MPDLAQAIAQFEPDPLRPGDRVRMRNRDECPHHTSKWDDVNGLTGTVVDPWPGLEPRGAHRYMVHVDGNGKWWPIARIELTRT